MAGDAFKKLRSSVNRGITTISVKTSSTLEKTKLKVYIETLNGEIENDIYNIGLQAYKIWQSQDKEYVQLDEAFEQLELKYSQKSKLTAQLDSIDERDSRIFGPAADNHSGTFEYRLICQNCGERYKSQVNFCRKCGNRLS